jgi:hypothetical protein
MRIVGECDFDMVMSGWKRPVHGIIVDLQADFDVVLGLNWLREVEPTPEWKTLNWYVQTAEGIVCLKHRNQVDPEPHRPKLTALQIDTKEDFEWITEKDAKKALRKGARCMLHYARAYIDDSNGRPRLNSIRDLGDVDDPKLQQLLEEYQDIFREELPKELPPEQGVVHAIDTGDEKPVNRNAYPPSAQQLREQTKQVQSLLERGLIRDKFIALGVSCTVRAKEIAWGMANVHRLSDAECQDAQNCIPPYRGFRSASTDLERRATSPPWTCFQAISKPVLRRQMCQRLHLILDMESTSFSLCRLG